MRVGTAVAGLGEATGGRKEALVCFVQKKMCVLLA